MTVNIPPTVLPTKKPNRQRFLRPWNTDPSCVLCLMPEVNTTWRDYSGHGNDGTIVGATTIHNARFGEGLLFDGTDDYVSVPDDDSLDLQTTLSCEAWISTVDANDQAIINKQDTTANFRGYLFFQDDEKICLEVNGWDGFAIGAVRVIGTTEINDGIWHHVVATKLTKDASSINLYVDGVLETMVTDTDVYDGDATNATALNVGRRYRLVGDELEWTGYIDEVRVYNRVLEAWEVRALFELGKP